MRNENKKGTRCENLAVCSTFQDSKIRNFFKKLHIIFAHEHAKMCLSRISVLITWQSVYNVKCHRNLTVVARKTKHHSEIV
jgi:hypothetical protein